MCDLLETRADMLTINITYNSLANPELGAYSRDPPHIIDGRTVVARA